MMNRRMLCLLISMLLLGAILIGLTSWISAITHSEPPNLIQGEERTIIDDWGRTVTIPVEAKRIVSLTSAYEPILLEMVGPNRLGAVSFLSKTKGYGPNYELAKSVKVSLYSYAVEKIVYLHPDLVIAPEYTSRDVIDGLEHMGIPVVIISNPKTVQETIALVERLGTVVGAEDKARSMTTKMKKDIEEVKVLSEKTKGQIVISMSSMDGYAGAGSLFDDMTRVMGLVNGPSHLRYAPRTAFTEERIIEMNPNVILIPVYDKSEMAWQTLYRDNPGLQTVKAVQDHRVLPMDASNLYAGNQFIGESMKDILRLLRESEKGEYTHE